MRVICSVALLMFAAAEVFAQKTADEGLKCYDHYLLQQKHDSLAAMFDRHGVLRIQGQPPVYGRDSIYQLFSSFKGAQVLSQQSTVDQTERHGQHITQRGAYKQVVVIPAGDTLKLTGKFTAVWKKTTQQKSWVLQMMSTYDYGSFR